MRQSVLGLSGGDYSPEQLASSLRHVFGMDTRLIEDGTYYVVEAGAGPWRAGVEPPPDAFRRRPVRRPVRRPARSARPKPRASAPSSSIPTGRAAAWARLLLQECERAARADGFRRLELMATLPGIPFYEREGFILLERHELELPDGVRFPLARMTRDLSPPSPGGRGPG